MEFDTGFWFWGRGLAAEGASLLPLSWGLHSRGLDKTLIWGNSHRLPLVRIYGLAFSFADTIYRISA